MSGHIFASGLGHPEGPVRREDGSWLVVEMDPARACVTKIDAAGTGRQVIARFGRPNGLALGRDGTIWVADSNPAALIALQKNGEVAGILRDCNAAPMLFLNDLCFGPDGMLYVTDSGILMQDMAPNGSLRPDYKTAPIDGRIYRVKPQTLEICQLTSGIRFANGIAFDPEGRFVYVSESITGNILRYLWSTSGLSNAEIFGNVFDHSGHAGFRMADGMAFGQNGHLYIAVMGQSQVVVLDRKGIVVKTIPTHGRMPSNVAFGGAGERNIYVTEDEIGTIEIHETETLGQPLHAG